MGRREFPKKDERELVIEELKKTWNVLADSWVNLRVKPVEEVVDFCYSIPRPKGKVLEVACGNGRNLVPFLERGFACVGVDFSKSMVREARKFLKKRGFDVRFVIADMRFLPFKDDSFACAINVRSLHHVPTRELRVLCLREMKRVCKNNSSLLLSVWKRSYPRFLIDVLKSLFSKRFEFGDVYKEWNYRGKVYKRFYHLYSPEELEKELEEAGLEARVVYCVKDNLVAKCEVRK